MIFRLIGGLALLLIGVGVILLPAALDKVTSAEKLEGNFPVNASAADLGEASSHNSPTLARNPTDGTNLAIANRIDSPAFSCALHVSFDGGANWGQIPIPVPAGEEPKCYVPDVTFDADGTLYLSFTTLAGARNLPNAVWLATSDDGGRTLSQPDRVLGKLAYQPRLAADPVDPGVVYVTWLQAAEVTAWGFPFESNSLFAIRSDDHGESWGDKVPLNRPIDQRALAPDPSVAADGTLHVAYLDLGPDALDYRGLHRARGGPAFEGTWELLVASSTDAGENWSHRAVDDIVPIERIVPFIPPFPSLAVAADGRVYVSFHDSRVGDPDVWLWVADEEGEAFSEPIKVNDTAAGDGRAQYLPELALAPDGRLDVVYYDRRSDSENILTDVSLQSSYDDGATFRSRIRLSDRSFRSDIGLLGERGLPQLGTRLGLLSTEARALVVWPTTVAASEETRKQDLYRAVVEFPDLRPPPPVVEIVLLTGGGAIILLGLLLALSWVVKRPPQAPPEEEESATADPADEVSV